MFNNNNHLQEQQQQQQKQLRNVNKHVHIITAISYFINFLFLGQCVDEHWCEDILENECSYFVGYCKKKCGTCDT
jgi:hypothetical protein